MAEARPSRGPYDVGSRMRHTDAFAWRMETDPRLRSTIVVVWLLDAPPDFDRLRRTVDRTTRLLPVFRQHVVEPPLQLGPPHFELDPHFDLRWHVRRITAPPPGTTEALLQYAATLTTGGFDLARPLWEILVVDGLAGGGAAMIAKFHHSLADGEGGIQMSEYLFDASPGAITDAELPPEPVAVPPRRYAGALGLARTLTSAGVVTMSAAARSLVNPVAAAAGAFDAAVSIAKTVRPMAVTLSPIMQPRSLSRALTTIDVSHPALTKAAHSAECSLNDAYVSALCGALRCYHEASGEVPEELRVTMPISIRNPEDAIGGNRLTLVRFRIPIAERDPVVRMKTLRERTTQWRHERSLPLTQQIASALNVVPRSYLQRMLSHVDVLASNVRGPAHAQFLAGARVVAFYAFGPTIGAAVNVTMVTYEGTCHIGSSSDIEAVTDLDTWRAALHEGFDEVTAIGRRNRRTKIGGVVA